MHAATHRSSFTVNRWNFTATSVSHASLSSSKWLISLLPPFFPRRARMTACWAGFSCANRITVGVQISVCRAVLSLCIALVLPVTCERSFSSLKLIKTLSEKHDVRRSIERYGRASQLSWNDRRRYILTQLWMNLMHDIRTEILLCIECGQSPKGVPLQNYWVGQFYGTLHECVVLTGLCCS